jgi:hypothetical protein
MAGPQARRSVEDLTQALYEASDPDGTPWVRRGRVLREPWLELARDRIARSDNHPRSMKRPRRRRNHDYPTDDPSLSCGCRCLRQLLIKRDQFGPELLRYPEVARVVSGQASRGSKLQSAVMIHGDIPPSWPRSRKAAISAGCWSGAAAIWSGKHWQVRRRAISGHQACVSEQTGNRLRLRFPEQQRGESRGIDDLNGHRDRHGSTRQPR